MLGAFLISILIGIPLLGLLIYLMVLVVRALRKYINSAPARDNAKEVRRTLSEKLRENRERCKMTQEFVAEAVGVSRQAVSKWENGVSDPSTANLISLAKLYGISADQLLEGL